MSPLAMPPERRAAADSRINYRRVEKAHSWADMADRDMGVCSRGGFCRGKALTPNRWANIVTGSMGQRVELLFGGRS